MLAEFLDRLVDELSAVVGEKFVKGLVKRTFDSFSLEEKEKIRKAVGKRVKEFLE